MDQFKEQVDTYETIYEDINKLEDIKTIEKWFRVDNKPFKQNLLNTVKKWSFMFKQHLMDDVTNRFVLVLEDNSFSYNKIKNYFLL